MQLTILDFMQLAHGSLRSQRILRVLHWMHESAGRLRRLGSASLRDPGLPAAERGEVGAGTGARGAASAGVDMSTSMSTGSTTSTMSAPGFNEDSISWWSPRSPGQGRRTTGRLRGI